MIAPDDYAGDLANQPITMTDYHTWTIMGVDAVPTASNTMQFAKGIGIVHSNGLWVTAHTGAVVVTDDAANFDTINIDGEVVIRQGNMTVNADHASIDARSGKAVLGGDTIEVEMNVESGNTKHSPVPATP